MTLKRVFLSSVRLSQIFEKFILEVIQKFEFIKILFFVGKAFYIETLFLGVVDFFELGKNVSPVTAKFIWQVQLLAIQLVGDPAK